MNMRFYRRLNMYFENRPESDRLLRRTGKILTITFYLAYFGLCIWVFLTDRKKLPRVLAVPCACYGSGTLIRAAINAPRPADLMPETKREGAKRGGKGFPSRHCFSASVIAAAFAWVNPFAGAAAAAAALVMAVLRVLEGEHFIRDTIAGLLYGALFGWAGFFFKTE